MKFWVKAVGEHIMEQLLVDVDSAAELQLRLEKLLGTKLHSISVKDLQKIEVHSGSDIVTVRVKTVAEYEREQQQQPQPPAASQSSQQEQRLDAEAKPPQSVQLTVDVSPQPPTALPQRSPSLTPKYRKDSTLPPPMTLEPDSVAIPELNLEGSSSAEISPAAATAPATTAPASGSSQSSLPRRRACSNPPSPSPNNGNLEAPISQTEPSHTVAEPSTPMPPPNPPSQPPTPSPARQGAAAADAATLMQLCLPRNKLVELIAPGLRGAFYPCVQGAFVRVRSSATTHAVYQLAAAHNDSQVLVDLLDRAELRPVETFSNAGATEEEFQAWMVASAAASVPPLRVAFVREKVQEIDAACKTLRIMENDLAAKNSNAPSRNDSPDVSPQQPLVRRHSSLRSLHEASRKQFLTGKSLVPPTNDIITGAFVYCDVAARCNLLIATRHSNLRSKQPRLSDFAPFALIFNEDFTAVQFDRDISFKGYSLGCAPVFFRGLFYATASPFDNRQHVALLCGRDRVALHNPPVALTLPRPGWSCDGNDCAPRAQLVPIGNALHVWWLSPMAGGQVGLAHAVSNLSSAKSLSLALVGDAPELTCGAKSLIHVDSCDMSGTDAVGITHVQLFLCNPEEELQSLQCYQSAIGALANGDAAFSPWRKLRASWSLTAGEWRSAGILSISHFSAAKYDYAVVVGQSLKHSHTQIMIVPVTLEDAAER